MIEELTSKKLGKFHRQYYSLLQCLFGTLKPDHVTPLHVWFLPDYHKIKASPKLACSRSFTSFPTPPFDFVFGWLTIVTSPLRAGPLPPLSRMVLISFALFKYSIHFWVIASLIFGFSLQKRLLFVTKLF